MLFDSDSVPFDSIFGMLSRRAGLSASAGLSCICYRSAFVKVYLHTTLKMRTSLITRIQTDDSYVMIFSHFSNRVRVDSRLKLLYV